MNWVQNSKNTYSRRACPIFGMYLARRNNIGLFADLGNAPYLFLRFQDSGQCRINKNDPPHSKRYQFSCETKILKRKCINDVDCKRTYVLWYNAVHGFEWSDVALQAQPYERAKRQNSGASADQDILPQPP